MIDLSNEFHPVPKIYKDPKKPKPMKKVGVKTKNWNEGREELKKLFTKWKITKCEIKLEGCLKDNFLGFAHTQRRVNLTPEETRDPKHVVLACQQCHQTCDFEMKKIDSQKLLEGIVKSRIINE